MKTAPLTPTQRNEITRISQEFASGFKEKFETINGTGWLIVDPLSAYLNSVGFENKAYELPENNKHCHVLTLKFKDGSVFIPAGGDLANISPNAKNWMWL